jgi:hypothetical protein
MGPFDLGGLELFREDLLEVKSRVGTALALAYEDVPGRARPPAGAVGELRKALEAKDVGLADRLIEELSSGGDRETRTILAAAADQILVSDYQAAIDLVGRI